MGHVKFEVSLRHPNGDVEVKKMKRIQQREWGLGSQGGGWRTKRLWCATECQEMKEFQGGENEELC